MTEIDDEDLSPFKASIFSILKKTSDCLFFLPKKMGLDEIDFIVFITDPIIHPIKTTKHIIYFLINLLIGFLIIPLVLGIILIILIMIPCKFVLRKIYNHSTFIVIPPENLQRQSNRENDIDNWIKSNIKFGACWSEFIIIKIKDANSIQDRIITFDKDSKNKYHVITPFSIVESIINTKKEKNSAYIYGHMYHFLKHSDQVLFSLAFLD